MYVTGRRIVGKYVTGRRKPEAIKDIFSGSRKVCNMQKEAF